MRAFISYAHEDRVVAGQAKAVLSEVGAHAFLAHEDLEVSDEWRDRIVEELHTCDVLIALLSKSFEASRWAPQEVGFLAIARPDVVIAPMSIDGTRSFGFFGHRQSPRIPQAGLSRDFLLVPIARRFPRDILPGLITIAGRAGSFRDAEAKMKPLVEFFKTFTTDEVEALARASISNGQIWCAKDCRTDYLPQLLQLRGQDMSPGTRAALQYQIEKEEWYRGESEAASS
jgi:hypothetical protein